MTLYVAVLTIGAILAGVLVAHDFGRRATFLVMLIWAFWVYIITNMTFRKWLLGQFATLQTDPARR